MTNPVPEDLGDYVELQCASHFSLLRGASSPGELFDEAQRLAGRPALPAPGGEQPGD